MIPTHTTATRLCEVCAGSGSQQQTWTDTMAMDDCEHCVGGRVTVPVKKPCDCGQSGGPEAYRAPSGTVYCCPVCRGHGTRPALWSYVFVGDPVLRDGVSYLVASTDINGIIEIMAPDSHGSFVAYHPDLTLDLSGDFSHRPEGLKP